MLAMQDAQKKNRPFSKCDFCVYMVFSVMKTPFLSQLLPAQVQRNVKAEVNWSFLSWHLIRLNKLFLNVRGKIYQYII